MHQVTAARLLYTILAFTLVAMSSCKSVSNVFRSESPHENYVRKLNDAGLQNTVVGRNWLRASTAALAKPTDVVLPYQERYYFATEGTRALGYKFSVLQGERVDISWQRVSSGGGKLFADLFSWNEGKPSLLVSADTLKQQLQYTSRRAETYLLRLQPELLQSMEVTVQIKAASSLAFPVPPQARPRTQSFWGADRDGGARRHEGIDIFAPHRTPVVAAAPGRVQRVGENNLGGKVVFVRTEAGSLYYAHLDEQLVSDGDAVKTGDTLGLMGNTGNARGGSSHLHFGIYAMGGAVDPYPYVRTDRPEPPALRANAALINTWVNNSRSIRLRQVNDSAEISLPAQTPLLVRGLERNRLRASTVEGKDVWIDAGVVSKASATLKTKTTAAVHEIPSNSAARITMLDAGKSVRTFGNVNGFVMIEADGINGWIEERTLR